MALRTKLARKVLTKKQQQHLTEMNINTMAQMQRMHEENEKRWAEFNDSDGPFHGCWECRDIAQRLGLWTRMN